MDIFDFSTKGTIKTEEVFTQDEKTDQMHGMYIHLKNLIAAEISTEWDIYFLQRYVTESIVPYSLHGMYLQRATIEKMIKSGLCSSKMLEKIC